MDDRASGNRRSGRSSLVGGLIVVVLVLSLVGPSVVLATDHDPGDPIAFYGGASDEGGLEAPVGTEIVAVVDGTEADRVTVDETGVYAVDDPTGEKLRTDTGAGEQVTFHVEDADGPQATQVHEIAEEGVFELHLTFPAGTFEDDQDEEDRGDDGSSGDDTSSDDPDDEEDDQSGPEILTDEDAIDAVADVPRGATPERAEVTGAVSTDNGSVATFSNDSTVERVDFDSEVGGDVVLVELEPGLSFWDDRLERSDTTSSEGDQSETSDVLPATDRGVSNVLITVPEASRNTSATFEMTVDEDRVVSGAIPPEELQTYRLPSETVERGNISFEAMDRIDTTPVDVDDDVTLEVETPGFSLFSVLAVSEPTAIIETSDDTIGPNEELTLDGSASTDEYGTIEEYQWQIGNQTTQGENSTVTLEDPGAYTLELTVTNEIGVTNTSTRSIEVEDTSSDDTPSTDIGENGDTDGRVDTGDSLEEPQENGNSQDEQDDDSPLTDRISPFVVLGLLITVSGLVLVNYLLKRKHDE